MKDKYLAYQERAYCEAQGDVKQGIHRLEPLHPSVHQEVEAMFAYAGSRFIEPSELAGMTVIPLGRGLGHASVRRGQFSVSNAENDEQDDGSVDLADRCTEPIFH